MSKKIGIVEAEKLLEKNYGMKYVTLTLPGYNPVVGRIDGICIDASKPAPEVAMMINEKRYSCSPEALRDCVKILNQ